MFTFEDNEGRKGFDIKNEKGVCVGDVSLTKIGQVEMSKDGSYFAVYYRVKVDLMDGIEYHEGAKPTYDDFYDFLHELFYMDTNRPGGLFCHRINLFADQWLDNEYVVVAHFGHDV